MGRGRVAKRVGRGWVAVAAPARPRPHSYPQLRGATERTNSHSHYLVLCVARRLPVNVQRWGERASDRNRAQGRIKPGSTGSGGGGGGGGGGRSVADFV
eukprot:3013537-Pyramimonas_sp.AAC.1